ncbi:hypothetical protein WA158_006262 [Blastocystis sp. Blastoise]
MLLVFVLSFLVAVVVIIKTVISSGSLKGAHDDDAEEEDLNDDDDQFNEEQIKDLLKENQSGDRAKELKKMLKKAMKRKEKSERKAAIDAEIENRKRKQEYQEEIDRRKEEERLEKIREEEAKLQTAEERKRYEDEYIYKKWKKSIVLLESGTVGVSLKEDEVINNIYQYLIEKKTIYISELQKTYRQTKDEIITLLKKIRDKYKLCILIDSQNCVHYITNEEKEQIIKKIREEGIMSIYALNDSITTLLSPLHL